MFASGDRATETAPEAAKIAAVTLAIPALLALVAVCQMSFGLWGALTPWKGGGFGMFASLDRPLHRYFSVTATSADGRQYAVDLRSAVARRLMSRAGAELALVQPTGERLTAIGRFILDAEVETVFNEAGAPDGVVFSAAPIAYRGVMKIVRPWRDRHTPAPIAGVRVSVLRLRFDNHDDSLRLVPIGPQISVTAAAISVGQ